MACIGTLPTFVTRGMGDWCDILYRSRPDLVNQDLVRSGAVMGFAALVFVRASGVITERVLGRIAGRYRGTLIGVMLILSITFATYLVINESIIISRTSC